MTTPITQADLDAVLAAHPLLSSDGYGDIHTLCPCRTPQKRDEHMARERADLRGALRQVQAAAQWLRPIARNAHATATSPSSYGLKHVMENQTGVYVTNGEFIAAALILGIPIHRSRDRSPNPGIGLNRSALRRQAQEPVMSTSTARFIGGPLDGQTATRTGSRWSSYRGEDGQPIPTAKGDREFYSYGVGGIRPPRRYYRYAPDDGGHVYVHASAWPAWSRPPGVAQPTDPPAATPATT